MLRALPTLGGGTLLGEWSECVIPGHDGCRARVLRGGRGGVFRYQCGPREGTKAWRSLAEVLASVVSGAAVEAMASASQAPWFSRLADWSGLIERPDVLMPAVPEGERPALYVVRDGLRDRLAYRWMNPGFEGTPVPFARTFAARWCGLTPDIAMRATSDLRRLGVVHVHDRQPQPPMQPQRRFLPGPYCAGDGCEARP